MDRIILASASPRRRDILRQMGIAFSLSPQDVDESFSGLPAAGEAVRIAVLKVEKCLGGSVMKPDTGDEKKWVLGADTFIELDGSYLGKPADREEASSMLRMLSGRTHKVITGLALHTPSGKIETSHCVTGVSFSRMSNEEIEWYLEQDEWQGAAAAYRVQEKGAVFIERLDGSFSNVMGLPINTFYGMLIAANYNFRA